MTDDDNDLTDRYDELTGNTLEDDWEDNPDPPERYGRPGPVTIFEEVGNHVWIWDALAWKCWLSSTKQVDIKQ